MHLSLFPSPYCLSLIRNANSLITDNDLSRLLLLLLLLLLTIIIIIIIIITNNYSDVSRLFFITPLITRVEGGKIGTY